MRIGVVPVLVPNAGGVYQYSLTMLEALKDPEVRGAGNEVVLVTGHAEEPDVATLMAAGWEVIPMRPRTLGRRVAESLENAGLTALLEALRGLRGRGVVANASAHESKIREPFEPDWEAEAWFRQQHLELMIFPMPMSLSFECGLPYVIAIHDLQHRLQPHFPEVSQDGQWEIREHLFRNGTRHATLILADSEVGKEDILACYGEVGIDADRIKVLPFLPASHPGSEATGEERERVLSRHALPERFVFYPAQFWPHKNHARLVCALAYLRDHEGLFIPLVLCGSHFNEIRERTYAEILALVDQTGLGEQVHYLGFVESSDVSALYTRAEALVMPTFFGPTNIPILEAWSRGCPVLTSDIRGVREQAGDGALLVDPDSVESIAKGIERLWTDEDLRQRLRNRGYRRLGAYLPEDYKARLKSVVAEATALV